METETTSFSESTAQLKARLQSMDDYAFEKFVADLWKKRGFSTQVSQEAVDAGIDVVATKQTPYPQKELIQAKRYSEGNKVGGPEIQQYASLKRQGENVDSVVVVTTSSFSRHAKERADDLNVKLVDGDQLVRLAIQLNATDLLSEYGVALRQETEEVHDSKPKQDTPPEVEIHLFVLVGVASWAVFWFLFLRSNGPMGLLELLFGGVAWISLPVGVFYDMREYSENRAATQLYTLSSAIPLLGFLVGLSYLSLRLRPLWQWYRKR